MSICPKNKSSKSRRDKRRANWKMSAPTLVKCSKCGALMMPHRVCKKCGKDLNEGSCGCDDFVPDVRLANLMDIFNAAQK